MASKEPTEIEVAKQRNEQLQVRMRLSCMRSCAGGEKHRTCVHSPIAIAWLAASPRTASLDCDPLDAVVFLFPVVRSFVRSFFFLSRPALSVSVVQEAQQLQQLIVGAEQKLVQLKNEAAEHGRVLATLNGVEESRKAFRLIGGVLVERTVGEVKPAVEANKEKIEEVVATLEADLTEKRQRFFVLKVGSCVGGWVKLSQFCFACPLFLSRRIDGLSLVAASPS